MALLSAYAMQNEIYRKISGTKTHTATSNKKTYVWQNKNRLLTMYRHATGGKTGFTERARRTLVTTASKNNLNLSVVTLNYGDDFNKHRNLYEDIFSRFSKYRILNTRTFYLNSDVHGDRLYIKNDFYYTMTSDETTKLTQNIVLEKSKNKVIDNVVGFIEIRFDNRVVHKENIYRKEEPRRSFWSRIFRW